MSNILLEADKFASRIDKEHNLRENAFYFQHEGKELFGYLHLPLNGGVNNKKTGIVMCQPYILEALHTERLEVNHCSKSCAKRIASISFPL